MRIREEGRVECLQDMNRSLQGFWALVHRAGDDNILMSLVLEKCYPECSGLENWVLRSRELENMVNR